MSDFDDSAVPPSIRVCGGGSALYPQLEDFAPSTKAILLLLRYTRCTQNQPKLFTGDHTTHNRITFLCFCFKRLPEICLQVPLSFSFWPYYKYSVLMSPVGISEASQTALLVGPPILVGGESEGKNGATAISPGDTWKTDRLKHYIISTENPWCE